MVLSRGGWSMDAGIDELFESVNARPMALSHDTAASCIDPGDADHGDDLCCVEIDERGNLHCLVIRG
jgi:hypothetical protein